MRMQLFKSLLLAIASVSLIAVNSEATITGAVYLNQPANANSGLISSIPVTSADAEFYTTYIDYTTNGTNGSINQFLDNPTFFNTNAAFDLVYNSLNSMQSTLLVFTGQMYLEAGDNNFTVAHDDGFELSVPGASFDLQQGGPFALTFTPYTITVAASGLYDFTLSYYEAWGNPGIISATINGQPIDGQVPEPTTHDSFRYWPCGSSRHCPAQEKLSGIPTPSVRQEFHCSCLFYFDFQENHSCPLATTTAKKKPSRFREGFYGGNKSGFPASPLNTPQKNRSLPLL